MSRGERYQNMSFVRAGIGLITPTAKIPASRTVPGTDFALGI